MAFIPHICLGSSEISLTGEAEELGLTCLGKDWGKITDTPLELFLGALHDFSHHYHPHSKHLYL